MRQGSLSMISIRKVPKNKFKLIVNNNPSGPRESQLFTNFTFGYNIHVLLLKVITTIDSVISDSALSDINFLAPTHALSNTCVPQKKICVNYSVLSDLYKLKQKLRAEPGKGRIPNNNYTNNIRLCVFLHYIIAIQNRESQNIRRFSENYPKSLNKLRKLYTHKTQESEKSGPSIVKRNI